MNALVPEHILLQMVHMIVVVALYLKVSVVVQVVIHILHIQLVQYQMLEAIQVIVHAQERGIHIVQVKIKELCNEFGIDESVIKNKLTIKEVKKEEVKKEEKIKRYNKYGDRNEK